MINELNQKDIYHFIDFLRKENQKIAKVKQQQFFLIAYMVGPKSG